MTQIGSIHFDTLGPSDDQTRGEFMVTCSVNINNFASEYESIAIGMESFHGIFIQRLNKGLDSHPLTKGYKLKSIEITPQESTETNPETMTFLAYLTSCPKE